jgi:hypothetical protein
MAQQRWFCSKKYKFITQEKVETHCVKQSSHNGCPRLFIKFSDGRKVAYNTQTKGG